MHDGVMSFSGYMIGVRAGKIAATVNTLIHDFSASFEPLYIDDDAISRFGQMSDTQRHIELYLQGTAVSSLMLDYDFVVADTTLPCRMLIDPCEIGHSVEIVCSREPVLAHPNPSDGIFAYIAHCRFLFEQFDAGALFVGPDCSDYPVDEDTYPDYWHLINRSESESITVTR